MIATSANAQESGQGSSGQFKVAAYNLENGFDVFDNPYTEDESTAVKSRDAWKAIAQAIKRMDADVVALSEVENQGVLEAMVRNFLPQAGYDHLAVMPSNDRRGINLGLISRFPIRSITSYRWRNLPSPNSDKTRHFARDVLHAKIQLPADPAASSDQKQAKANANANPNGNGKSAGNVLHLFEVHLKSKRDTDGDKDSIKWRTAEARMVRRMVSRLIDDQPNALALVVGDFNANPNDPTMKLMLQPAQGQGEGGGKLLTDLHAWLSKTQRITYPSEQYPDDIFDYILASPAMRRRFIKGSAGLLRDKTLTRGSDHRPVFASFRLADTDR